MQGSEEVALELREGKGVSPPPTDVTTGWSVEFVWKVRLLNGGGKLSRLRPLLRLLKSL